MKVLIDVNYGLDRLSIVANESQNIFTANGKPINFDMMRFMFKVCDVTMNWPVSLEDENKTIKDGTRVVILIEDDKQRKVMKYINRLPEDYYKLEILLDEVSNNVETSLRQVD